MQRLAASHTRVDSAWFSICRSVPTLLDVRRRGIESVVSFVVEGHRLESSRSFLDVGAGTNFIISEENRASSVTLEV